MADLHVNAQRLVALRFELGSVDYRADAPKLANAIQYSFNEDILESYSQCVKEKKGVNFQQPSAEPSSRPGF